MEKHAGPAYVKVAQALPTTKIESREGLAEVPKALDDQTGKDLDAGIAVILGQSFPIGRCADAPLTEACLSFGFVA